MEHFNELTPAEAERLAILSEECAEVIQACTKILRHGWDSFNPNFIRRSNRESLNKELGDLCNILDMMSAAEDINAEAITEYQEEKAELISRYLHHNEYTN